MIIDQLSFPVRRLCAIALVIGSLATPAFADETSKEVCIDAHSRGQDARDQSKLSLARKLFLTCAQPSCPALVQGDCARFADDLTRMQPSVSFAARDARGVDLANTSVFVDDILIASRLDDGKAHDIDPGKHVVKFVHAGKEQVLAVVVGTGERGRTISVTFGAPPPIAAPAMTAERSLPARPTPRTHHALGSKVLVGTGIALAAGGGTLGVLGLTRVPANCSLSSHQCAAPPGDPSFEDARDAVKLSNIGWVVGGIGVGAIVGGVIWYVKSGDREVAREDRLVTPWITPNGAGIALGGRL